MLGQPLQESARLKDVLVPPTDRAYSGFWKTCTAVGCLMRPSWSAWPSLVARPAWTATEDVTTGARSSRSRWREGASGGQVYGASDRIGAYPAEGRVRPEDLSATIFHCLGYAPETEYRDPLDRPHPISRGEVIHAIL